MSIRDWETVIDNAAEMGVRAVQFIGGEPTLHPSLPNLVDRAVLRGLQIEVYSNLVHVSPQLWSTFSQTGVSLACSYYSDSAVEHAAITRRPSHARTRANIVEALRRSIPLRVGVVGMTDEQRTDEAMKELRELGVKAVGYDHLRQFGRGVSDQFNQVDQLCGNCADGAMAIGPTGDVWPCVFSRWMPVGNVTTTPLAEVLNGERARQVRTELDAAFGPRGAGCFPGMCDPDCSPACSPSCIPTGTCFPAGGCIPHHECSPRYDPVEPLDNEG
jgi:MoaA/NifB/PqqE/SkfB family radical SAM enzyme